MRFIKKNETLNFDKSIIGSDSSNSTGDQLLKSSRSLRGNIKLENFEKQI